MTDATSASDTVLQLDEQWGLDDQQRSTYARIPAAMDFVPDESFNLNGAEDQYFGQQAEDIEIPNWTYFPEIPEASPPRQKNRAKLKAGEEKVLFLRYNYARFRVSVLLDEQKAQPTVARAQDMVLWYERAMKTRSALVKANMPLVLAMAKRTRIPNVDFGELISEGNMALLRSVEKFDASRGFKFSTYACRAILKSFNRLATKTGRHRQRFPTEYDPSMERSDYDTKKHEMQRDSSVESLRDVLAQNRANLSEVERVVIMERFAIGQDGKGHTLAEVGKMVGLTNERVRQIQNLALVKLRGVLEGENVG